MKLVNEAAGFAPSNFKINRKANNTSITPKMYQTIWVPR